MTRRSLLILALCGCLCAGLPAQGACTQNMALSFDGLDDFAVVPHHASLNAFQTDSFTVELWFKSSALLVAPIIDSLLEKWNGTCATPYPYVLRLESGGVLKGASYDAISCSQGAGVVSGSLGPANDGKWHHVAYSRDGALVSRLFVDGFRVGTNFSPPLANISNNIPVYIGRRGPGGPFPNYFTGLIDEIRISKVTRYIGNFRPEPRFLADADTVLLLHLDDGAGNIATDSSGLANDALLGGSLLPVAESPAWVTSTLPVPFEGLASQVNVGPFNGAFKIVNGGDVVQFGIQPGCHTNLLGAPLTLVMNIGAQAFINGLTPPAGNSFRPLVGFNALNTYSAPSGFAILMGDGLGLGTIGLGLNPGFPPLTVGGPNLVLPVPVGFLPPSLDMRLQGLYLLTDAPGLRLGVTNEIFLRAAP